MRSGTPRALALTVLISLALAGCQSSAKKHLYAAEDLFEKRDLKGAQAELRESVKEDPSLTDAHNSLARVDEYLHDYDEAGKEFMIASQQDPTNQKTMAKARYYRFLAQITQQADKALDEVKSGDSDTGMKDLKAALQETKTQDSRDHVIADIKQAIPPIVQSGDQQVQQKKFVDAANTYQIAIRGYMYIAEATQKPMDAGADPVIAQGERSRQKWPRTRHDFQDAQRRADRRPRQQDREHRAGASLYPPYSARLFDRRGSDGARGRLRCGG